MNITMQVSDDINEMMPINNFSDGAIHEVSQPDCTDNTSPVAGVWNGTLKIEYTNQFDCTYNDGTIHETENREQNISLNLKVEEIDFG